MEFARAILKMTAGRIVDRDGFIGSGADWACPENFFAGVAGNCSASHGVDKASHGVGKASLEEELPNIDWDDIADEAAMCRYQGSAEHSERHNIFLLSILKKPYMETFAEPKAKIASVVYHIYGRG